MKRIYMFLAEDSIDRDLFLKSLEAAKVEGEVKFLTDKEGYINASSLEEGRIVRAIKGYSKGKIAFLSVDKDTPENRKQLHEALGYYPNRLSYLSDIFLKQMSFGDYACLKYFSKMFKGIDKELLETAEIYLNSGLDGKKASEAMYLHRNTTLFRLKKFKDITGLDLRDYHDALLLEIYLHFLPY